MSNSRKKRRMPKDLEKLARVKEDARKVADAPLADVEAEALTDDEAQAVAKAYEEAMEETGEKMVEVVGSYNPFGGAQSWEDLDNYLEAEATSDAVRQTEYEFRKMVNNVLEDESLSLEQKSSKINALATGFPSRATETAEDNKDVDNITKVLSFLGLDEVAKARLTRAAINDLPDSDFAYIEPGGKKDADGRTTPRGLRHYPIQDAAHVRNALARAAQQIKKGGKSGEVAKKALPRIRAAAKKLKIGKSSGFMVQKDLAGNYRWIGWVSNKYRDREKEIIAEAAHKEFIDYVYSDPSSRMPALWLWHTFKTATEHRADWIEYSDGFLIESGPLTEKEAIAFISLGEKYDIAMSHGFYQDARLYDRENGIINKYRQFEASVLPREHVANEWTDFATLQEVKEMGFTDERRVFLVEALGEEKVAELEASTKDMSEELKALGIEFKEAEIAEEETQPIEAEETEEEEGKSVVNVSLAAEALIEKMGLPALSDYLKGQATTIEEQGATIAALTAQVKELTKSSDEKVAESLTPRVGDQLVWLSQSKETEVKDDDPLLETGPKNEKGASWIQETHGGVADPAAIPN